MKSEYSLIEIIKLKGIGSPRVISLNSSNKVSIKDNRLFINFQLKPNSLIIIERERNIELHKEKIVKIIFRQRKLKVKIKSGYKIVYDSIVQIITADNKILKYYSTVQSFKSLKKFFSKEWLNNIVTFENSNETIVDNNIYLLDSFSSITELF